MRRLLLLFICIAASPLFLRAQPTTVGLQLHKFGSLDSGYVLFAPMGNNTTYMIDKCGKMVHQWESTTQPGLSVYFLPNGYLLRTGLAPGDITFGVGGTGGLIEKLDWNGKVVWSYKIADTSQCAHHDIEPLPNGNILVISWDKKSNAVEKAAGRKTSLLTPTLWSEKIVELKPTGTSGATIVWQWNVWDHLIQHNDSKLKNYDDVSAHPELIDINYVGDSGAIVPDWLHMNSVKYNLERDEIVLSIHNWSEIWIIDHSTTTAEAASHKGGNRGKGGDLLYRWGNPAAYENGSASDQHFFMQHDPYWIPNGFKNSGKIMVFNNGLGRKGIDYSSVEIITPPLDSSGNYVSKTLPFGPKDPDWIYTAPNKTDFYSNLISGAQVLSNGNVLVCSGSPGDMFEIDSTGQKVWEYINPVTTTGPVKQGTPSGFAVFRSTYYSAKYSGFKGHFITSGSPIEGNPVPYACTLNPADTTLPIANFDVQDTAVYINTDTVVLNNFSTKSLAYSWSISPTTFSYVSGSTSNSKSPHVVFTSPGYYSVSLTATGTRGRKSTMAKTSYIHAIQKAGVWNAESNYGLSIYPNPASDGLFLHFISPRATGRVNVSLSNTLGQSVFEKTVVSGPSDSYINLSGMVPGMYVLHWKAGEENYTEKIILK